jgi:hypothetical protein
MITAPGDIADKENKPGNKENKPGNRKQVVHRKNPERLHWQTNEMTTNDKYATNLFNKILHFKDGKYPLF